MPSPVTRTDAGARAPLATALLIAILLCAAPSAAVRGVTFHADDGVTLAGLWYEPFVRPAPAVVLVHMLHRTRGDWEPLASRLAAEGIGVLAFDLRGHGASGGAIPEQDAYDLFLKDVAAARRYVVSRGDVAPFRVGVGGASIGANLAVLDAAASPGATSLALLSPSLDYRGLRIEAAIRKVSAPILLVAGEDDPYAVRSTHELVKAGGGVRETLMLPWAGHGTNMFSRSPDLVRQLVDWFRRTL